MMMTRRELLVKTLGSLCVIPLARLIPNTEGELGEPSKNNGEWKDYGGLVGGEWPKTKYAEYLYQNQGRLVYYSSPDQPKHVVGWTYINA